jgi:4-hydroxy-tetrahydrodipicolinate synthase
VDLHDVLRAGELSRAQALYAELTPLLEFVVAGGPATTVTAGPELLGVGVGDPRRPLLPLDDDGRAALKEVADRR